MGSRVWTVDSFDVDDQSMERAGNSYDGEARPPFLPAPLR